MRDQRRRAIRNSGAAFVACCLGFVAGYLIQRGGWGGQFGTIVAFLSAVLSLFCGAALLLAMRG
jgi:hypothetical protein